MGKKSLRREEKNYNAFCTIFEPCDLNIRFAVCDASDDELYQCCKLLIRPVNDFHTKYDKYYLGNRSTDSSPPFPQRKTNCSSSRRCTSQRADELNTSRQKISLHLNHWFATKSSLDDRSEHEEKPRRWMRKRDQTELPEKPWRREFRHSNKRRV